MDFIERIFNTSPDGGSGATEFFWLIVVLAGLGFLLVRGVRKLAKQAK